MKKNEIKELIAVKPIGLIFEVYPYMRNFFAAVRLDEYLDESLCLLEILKNISDEYLYDYGLTKESFINILIGFIDEMKRNVQLEDTQIETLTIVGGYDKNGVKENIRLTLKIGEITCIVGPTGSGKSRLLEDIECMAQGDTPTNRKILINGQLPSDDVRFSAESKLVAQLSQNMNFVMDLSVEDFIKMHAQSRKIQDIDGITDKVLFYANALAGEEFNKEIAVTQLSGGQSRALMIADTAFLSSSPIVLIDEIENAGVDRKKSMELLAEGKKIILVSTHDPILALMGNRRVVIKSGGIVKVLESEKSEKKNLIFMEAIDIKMTELRNLIRKGVRVDFNIKEYFNN